MSGNVEIIGNCEFVSCAECRKLYRKVDLNEHLWSHAKTKYQNLPTEKQSGRFKQLRKFLPSQYPVGGVDPNKEKHRRKFYDSIGKPLPPVKVKKEPTSSSNTRKPPESSKPSHSKIEPTESKVQKKKRTPNAKNKSQPSRKRSPSPPPTLDDLPALEEIDNSGVPPVPSFLHQKVSKISPRGCRPSDRPVVISAPVHLDDRVYDPMRFDEEPAPPRKIALRDKVRPKSKIGEGLNTKSEKVEKSSKSEKNPEETPKNVKIPESEKNRDENPKNVKIPEKGQKSPAKIPDAVVVQIDSSQSSENIKKVRKICSNDLEPVVISVGSCDASEMAKPKNPESLPENSRQVWHRGMFPDAKLPEKINTENFIQQLENDGPSSLPPDVKRRYEEIERELRMKNNIERPIDLVTTNKPVRTGTLVRNIPTKTIYRSPRSSQRTLWTRHNSAPAAQGRKRSFEFSQYAGLNIGSGVALTEERFEQMGKPTQITLQEGGRKEQFDLYQVMVENPKAIRPAIRPVYRGVIVSGDQLRSRSQIEVGNFESSRVHASGLNREPVIVIKPTKEDPVVDLVNSAPVFINSNEQAMSPIRTGDRDRSLTTTPNLNDPEPSSKVSSSKPQTGVIIIDSDSDHESSRNRAQIAPPNPNAVQHVKYQKMLENNSITSSASTLEHLNAMGLLPILSKAPVGQLAGPPSRSQGSSPGGRCYTHAEVREMIRVLTDRPQTVVGHVVGRPPSTISADNPDQYFVNSNRK